MAEMLIDGAKLDACLDAEADAIRAKTGDTNPIPYDYANNKGFADAIAAIPSGGGGRTLLADYTAAEDVSAIQIDFTEAMRGYGLYRIVMEGTFNKSPYPYVGVNTTTGTSYLNSFSAGGAVANNTRWECFVGYVGGVYFFYAGNRETPINGDLQYFHTRVYNADAVFKSGFNLKIWGYTE